MRMRSTNRIVRTGRRKLSVSVMPDALFLMFSKIPESMALRMRGNPEGKRVRGALLSTTN